MFTKILDDEVKIKELLKKDNPIILECGANVGRTSKGFLERFSKIQLFCFEPDPRNVLKFKKNVQDSRCSLIEAAVSDIDGEVLLKQSGGYRPGQPNYEDTDSSTIKGVAQHVKLHPWIKYKESIKVKSIKLDTWRRNQKIEIIDFIWADVEGAEEELIKGGLETLWHTRYFYTEYSNNEAYDGEIILEEIRKLIPNFTVMKCWNKDVLFKNRNF